MGLFSKKPKLNPVIDTQGLRIEYSIDHAWWEFTHQGVNFISYGANFSCPSREQLRSILSDVEKLKPEMIMRLADGWKDWKGIKMNDGETICVNLTDFQSQGSFEVSWAGGSTWGDMGIDFIVKDHALTDEAWGD
jgi:hypothetical protein